MLAAGCMIDRFNQQDEQAAPGLGVCCEIHRSDQQAGPGEAKAESSGGSKDDAIRRGY